MNAMSLPRGADLGKSNVPALIFVTVQFIEVSLSKVLLDPDSRKLCGNYLWNRKTRGAGTRGQLLTVREGKFNLIKNMVYIINLPYSSLNKPN